MAEITAGMVKSLRDATGAGMMECKKALQESDGDITRAGAILREAGAAKAVKRAERAMKEGRIEAKVSADKKTGAMVEVNCETDFASRSDRFGALVENASATALAIACDCTDGEKLLAAKPVMGDAPTIQQAVTDTIGVVGENMAVSRCACFVIPAGKNGTVKAYIHPPGKVGVLVELITDSEATAQAAGTLELAHNLCLQIAFSAPVSIDSKSIPAAIIASESEIYRNQAIKEGKPEKILDKIVEGRLKAFFKESCLLEQNYVKDEKASVADLIAQTEKAVNGKIELARFSRFQLGESTASEE